MRSMIERGDLDGLEFGAHASPFAGRDALTSVCFASLGVTGPDTTIDGVVRFSALRRDALGMSFEARELVARPFDRDDDGSLSRAAAKFALELDDLALAPSARDSWREFASFVGRGPLIVPIADEFRAWCEHLEGTAANLPKIVGLDQIATVLLATRANVEHDAELAPREVARRLGSIVGRFLGLDRASLRLALSSWLATWHAVSSVDEELAETLRVILQLIEHPSRWTGACEAREFESASDGLASDATRDLAPDRAADAVRDQVDALRPRWAVFADLLDLDEPVPVHFDTEAPLSESDRNLVDDVFRIHLPALAASRGSTLTYRAGQHHVAREVARTLGRRELLLVHAPTGTGKTLAYLVPALVWAARTNRRVGVSTYTRALQEQAMQSEVPRALAALERAGFERRPIVTSLKGRANYLCWRALRTQVPQADDAPASWLAWSALITFALVDAEGDLDHFPPRLVLCSGSRAHLARELEPMLRAVRAQTGCCHERADRRTCAAEIARARAERSHVVVTNHAFALARQDFFKNIVFDECEHLHEQAHAAWSHTLALADIRELLTGLAGRDEHASRAPFDRLKRTLFEATPAFDALHECYAARELALGALDALAASIGAFKVWRDGRAGDRSERERFSLLREWLESDRAVGLIEAHAALLASLARLDVSIAALLEHCAKLQVRGIARLRRALERARVGVVETGEALDSWLPRHEGKPNLARETFYDLEEDPRRGDVLAARVLLPNEYLGRNYYPQLWSGVLISATTWLRDGFECASSYLGLDRAAEPLEFEVREPCTVRTARAEDPFDYDRVRVFVPRDAPEYATERERYHEYVRRFIAHLAERTRGRMLVLFTNADELKRTALELEGFFRARRLPFWWQNMRGTSKEELGDLFRARNDSVLFGVDTFWYGADFAGETLEYLVIVKLPWGVPDRYHHAQCAALGDREQRRRIYLPRALAKFRQGFGRLMRRESDRGSVFILDARVLRGQNRLFLGELPLANGLDGMEEREWRANGARLVVADTDACIRQALEHGDLLDDLARRGLDHPFEGPLASDDANSVSERAIELDPDLANDSRSLRDPPPTPRKSRPRRPRPPPPSFLSDDLPF